jgi:hypothetical protein
VTYEQAMGAEKIWIEFFLAGAKKFILAATFHRSSLRCASAKANAFSAGKTP